MSIFFFSADVAVSPMTYEEQDQFKAVSSQMKQHLQNSIANFWYVLKLIYRGDRFISGFSLNVLYLISWCV